MENITNQELRQRLMSLGFNSPPVTGTSRDLLLKKLKKLETSNGNHVANNSISYDSNNKYEAKNKRSRNSGKFPDSSPERPIDNYIIKTSPSVIKTPPSSVIRTPASNVIKTNDKPAPRQLRNKAEEEKISYDSTDSVSSKKVSPSYAEKYPSRTKDPFEKGSDSDDSVNYVNSSSSFLTRKPLSSRRESEYYSAVRPSSIYRKLDSSNGVSSYLNRELNLGKGHSGVSKTGRWTKLTSKISVNKIIPSIVLFAFLLFFILVAGIYFTKDDRVFGELVDSELRFPKCSQGEKDHNCVSKEGSDITLACFKTLYRALWKAKTNHLCDGKANDPATNINGEIVTNLFIKENNLLRFEGEKMLENVKILSRSNPQLGIVWHEKEATFGLDNTELPWRCTFKSWFALLIDYALYAGVTMALLFSMHILFRWGVNRHQAHTKGTQNLIKGILEILQQNAITNPSQNYLPIVHVRDQLITFADRERKKKMWADAVKYVEENESRIRKEMQPFQGEDYDVWRWVGGHQLSPPKPKTWQGEAFETSKDTMNTPSTSPTECLKIRHMFDPKNENSDEDWVTGVKDAILERCEGVNIIHMVVDESSPEGCVYIKCASTDDAGKAYRKMHGAWFDGKIVSVKYLRLERYHVRFPSSAGVNRPLFPSNDQKRSIV